MKTTTKLAAVSVVVLMLGFEHAAVAEPQSRQASARAASGDAQLLFESPQFTSFVGHPQSVTVADVTGDGFDDVVATTQASPQSSNELMIIPQESDGSLGQPQGLPIGRVWGGGLDTGDLNGDGKVDVAIALESSVAVSLQSGGTLQPPTDVAPLVTGEQVEVADVTGDGLNDIVALSQNDIELLLNTGSGFTSEVITDEWADEIELDDVTGDGRPDLIVGYAFSVRVYPNDGNGGFAQPLQYDPSAVVHALGTGDMNGDGRGDVVAAVGGNGDSKLNVFRQAISGHLAPPVVLESKDIPDSVDVGDLNGDGRVDVVVGHGTWHSIGVYMQRANGTLGDERLTQIPYQNFDPKGIATGDVNGDGATDVLMADSTGKLMRLVQRRELKVTAPRRVRLGESAAWQVHLGEAAATSNRVVDVEAVTTHGTELVREASVSDSGDLSGRLSNLRENTTLRVTWGGDTRSAPIVVETRVIVPVVTTGALAGFDGTSGRYKLYPAGDPIRYVGQVVPHHRGTDLAFELE